MYVFLLVAIDFRPSNLTFLTEKKLSLSFRVKLTEFNSQRSQPFLSLPNLM